MFLSIVLPRIFPYLYLLPFAFVLLHYYGVGPVCIFIVFLRDDESASLIFVSNFILWTTKHVSSFPNPYLLFGRLVQSFDCVNVVSFIVRANPCNTNVFANQISFLHENIETGSDDVAATSKELPLSTPNTWSSLVAIHLDDN